MKIILDCFIFYNELDLLKYRLEILNGVVDYFILVESKYTFTGKLKELYYTKHAEMFEKYHHKIIHIVEDTAPHIYPNIDTTQKHQWTNEEYQRNCIAKGIQQFTLHADDLILISDLDEIPDPETLKKAKRNQMVVTANSLEQDMYYYNLNSKQIDPWYSSKILTFQCYQQWNVSCTQLRFSNFPSLSQGGWHLSNFGDKYFIQNKLNHFAHQEFNTTEINNVDSIEHKINSGTDLFGREDNAFQRISIHDNPYLPPDCKIKLAKYILF